MYRIGLSCFGFALTDESFERLRDSGIDAVELSMPLEQHRRLRHKELAERSRRYGIELWSYHLPFAPFRELELSSLEPEIRKNTLSLYTEQIEKAADIGISRFIVHPSGEPIDPSIREERLKYSMQSLDLLAEIAHKNGAIIAVEDLPRSCLGNRSDEILRLIGVNDKLKVCFDTNHLLEEDNLTFIERLAQKIVTLHVSDYDLLDEKHWLPGEGAVNWQGLLAMLKKIDYRGVWLYEVDLKSPPTLTRSRDLTFDDFRENALALFVGKTPPRIL